VQENRQVGQVFVGAIAPIPAAKTSLYDPGCQVK
jgi:hypothetical protein